MSRHGEQGKQPTAQDKQDARERAVKKQAQLLEQVHIYDGGRK